MDQPPEFEIPPKRKRSGFASVVERTRARMPHNALLARKQLVAGMGTVRLHLDEYCRENGIVIPKGPHAGRSNKAELFRRTGLSKDALFYMLRYPETVKQIHFRTLARLCHGLNCTPGDLIVYDRAADSPTPLSETYKREPTSGLD